MRWAIEQVLSLLTSKLIGFNDLQNVTNILAQRMQRCITKLIKLEHTGFIPGGQGAKNIRRTLNIISCTKIIPSLP